MLAVQPVAEGAVDGRERRLLALVLEGDVVKRATVNPVSFSRADVVLVLQGDQVNRLFILC
jgi:hypothetical protein